MYLYVILSKLSCSRNDKNYSPFFIVWQVKTFHSIVAIQFCYMKSNDKYIYGLPLIVIKLHFGSCITINKWLYWVESLHIYQYLEFLSTTPLRHCSKCPSFTFLKRGIPIDNRYLCQPSQKCSCGVSCDCYTLVKFTVTVNPYLLHKVCDFNEGTLF
jgi:hypothetical protein